MPVTASVGLPASRSRRVCVISLVATCQHRRPHSGGLAAWRPQRRGVVPLRAAPRVPRPVGDSSRRGGCRCCRCLVRHCDRRDGRHGRPHICEWACGRRRQPVRPPHLPRRAATYGGRVYCAPVFSRGCWPFPATAHRAARRRQRRDGRAVGHSRNKPAILRVSLPLWPGESRARVAAVHDAARARRLGGER